MPHRNAPLTETGRLRLARCVVEDGWPLHRAAERFQVSPTTASRWAGQEVFRTSSPVPVSAANWPRRTRPARESHPPICVEPTLIRALSYYAYDSAADTHWAMADFVPSSTAPSSVQVAFQDGAGNGMFRMVGTGAWQVQINFNPTLCGELKFFPPTVLMAWALPTTAPAGLCP